MTERTNAASSDDLVRSTARGRAALHPADWWVNAPFSFHTEASTRIDAVEGFLKLANNPAVVRSE